MTDRILPSDELSSIRWHLRQSDNALITAQDIAIGNVELSEEILKIRRPLNDLIKRFD